MRTFFTRDPISQEELKKLVIYDPVSGEFFEHNGWKYDYCEVSRFSEYGAPHRTDHLAWRYVHGTWPYKLRHLDNNVKNNSIDNLEEIEDPNPGKYGEGHTSHLTQKQLRSVLTYDAITDTFSRKGKRPRGGTLKIWVMGDRYDAKDLVWLYIMGDGWHRKIKHRDGDTSNTAIWNLSCGSSYEIRRDEDTLEFYITVTHGARVHFRELMRSKDLNEIIKHRTHP